MSSAFSSYFSTHTGIYTDLNSTFQFPEKNWITKPYIKSLMQETNVSTGRVGPTQLNELGYYTYGGLGYNRANTPKVDVNRSSIWEDYTNRNATAVAYVDGIGTISPVNADASSFLSNQWTTRPGDSIIPEIIFIGLGGKDEDDPDDEANASVIGFASGPQTLRQIDIINQGKGYEPNSTMAVLHYPLGPDLYWTFDRHESLFEDSNQARYQPSPAWNREVDQINLRHHWKMDSNKSEFQDGSIKDEVSIAPSDLHLVSGNALNLENNFTWALKNKGVIVQGDDLRAITPFDDNFTLSLG